MVRKPLENLLDPHDISSALDAYEKRPGVSEEEMARLNISMRRASIIRNTAFRIWRGRLASHGAVCWCAGHAVSSERRPRRSARVAGTQRGRGRRRAAAAYRLLEGVRRFRARTRPERSTRRPEGLGERGAVPLPGSRTGARWEIISSVSSVGTSSCWERWNLAVEEVRNVLEECGTSEMASGMQWALKLHQHASTSRGEGGAEEREPGTRYRIGPEGSRSSTLSWRGC